VAGYFTAGTCYHLLQHGVVLGGVEAKLQSTCLLAVLCINQPWGPVHAPFG
jgi:hypothetical protein